MIINNIKEFRRLKRLSLRQLASMTGISKAALNSFERGITSPTLEHLMPIAAALEIKAKDLFYETSLKDFGGDEMDEDLKEAIELLYLVKDRRYIKIIISLLKSHLNEE
ncbi:MAG TPA: hypothetical protein DC038_07025 [Clostridiales bacterium]|nr:hypothetical protein [Clostridiales bacterium]